MNVFLYSHEREYVTALLIRQLAERGWLCLSTNQWVQEVRLHERFSKDQFTATWKLGSQQWNSNANDRIIDRVFDLTNLELNLKPEEHDYLLGELYAYLFYIRNYYPRYTTTLHHHAPFSWQMNLLEQWSWIRTVFPNVETPDYVFPFNGLVSEWGDPQQTIVSSPENLNKWKPCDGDPRVENQLLVKRPQGTPVLMLASEQETTTETEPKDIPPVAFDLAQGVRREMKVPLVEVLMFFDQSKGNLTFVRAALQPSQLFNERTLTKSLEPLYGGCA